MEKIYHFIYLIVKYLLQKLARIYAPSNITDSLVLMLHRGQITEELKLFYRIYNPAVISGIITAALVK